ncbi:MAG: diacylglycerol kinase family lipid kinase [Actinomycetota bacterium]|nr:diacylglycerol kinase family lipid kinase [Actinomycetota bacterium]
MSIPSLERLGESLAIAPAARSKRMLVIANPYATTMSDRLKHLVIYALQGRYEVEAQDTQRSGHAIELCREAAREGYDVVVAFGGDGTVNEVASGLAGSQTPMAVLPGGATNVYCRMLGIPNDVVDATEHLLRLADDFRPRQVDLGMAGGRAFTFAAGVGLDASVVERVDGHPLLKARLGAWYFSEAAVATFLRRYVVRPPRLELEVDGRRLEGVSAFVQNGGPYTYFHKRPIHLVEDVGLDSGELGGVVLGRAGPLDVPPVMYRALSGRPRVTGHRRVHGFEHARELVVRSGDERPLPVQVDGDYIGEHAEVGIRVAAGALRLVA